VLRFEDDTTHRIDCGGLAANCPRVVRCGTGELKDHFRSNETLHRLESPLGPLSWFRFIRVNASLASSFGGFSSSFAIRVRDGAILYPLAAHPLNLYIIRISLLIFNNGQQERQVSL
jgi:hypothetical protein